MIGVTEGGRVRQELGGCWLALLGGGVKLGIAAVRSGWGEAWRRGFSRRVISCNSWLSWDTCLERLFISSVSLDTLCLISA